MRWSRPESDFAGPLCDSLEPDPKPEKIYNAHNNIAARYLILENEDKILQCDGLLIDEIAGLGAPEYGYFDWDDKRVVQCAKWHSSYGDETATTNALYKALLGARIVKGRHVEDRHSAVLSLPSTLEVACPQFAHRGWLWLARQEGYYFKWERRRDANDSLMLGTRTLRSHFVDMIPENAKELTYMEVYSTMCRMIMERRFMLTQNDYFDWAPDSAYDDSEGNGAQTGDLIAVIYGCSTPLVIRTIEEGRSKTVGEAYVEGFMNGEAIGTCQSGNFQGRTFAFC